MEMPAGGRGRAPVGIAGRMTDFPAAMPHGPLVEVFPDVFMVTGGFRFAPGVTISRNMTVLRHRGELTFINSVRLSDAGEAEIEKLGRPKHLLRIGAFHGADDPWFMKRFGTTLWAPPGMRHSGDLKTGEELREGNVPVADMGVFTFAAGRRPEVALRLDIEGGVLVTCDAYQNWTHFDDCSLLGRLMMRAMGFGPTLIGGPWAKQMGPGVRADFTRLTELPFRHLIPGHGTVLREEAKPGLTTAIQNRFGG